MARTKVTKKLKSVKIIDLSDSDEADELNIRNLEDESKEELHHTTLTTPPPTVSKRGSMESLVSELSIRTVILIHYCCFQRTILPLQQRKFYT